MPSESECPWKKMIGEPCAGKPHARFDEEELEIEPFGDYASSLLYRTCRANIEAEDIDFHMNSCGNDYRY